MLLETMPRDYIINPPFHTGGFIQSDFALKALRFLNDTDTPLEILSLTFYVYAGGRKVKEIRYAQEALDARLQDGYGRVRNAGEWGLKSMIGSSIPWKLDALTGEKQLATGQEAAVINEYFIVVHSMRADRLEIAVEYIQDGVRETVRSSLPLIDYHAKNEYTFPVRGVWQINGNYDCLGAHRTQYSMEFAFDLGQLHPSGLCAWKPEMTDEDFLAYGKEVLAIADGEVVDCFNDAYWRVNFPHDDASDDEKAARAEIERKVGRLPIQCGNYVVLKHENSEYSFYGHMIKGSVRVEKGERVRRGDVLGQIGNVGFSGAPHLHFHLMAGPDFYSARGLPCHFTNLTDCFGNPTPLIQEEYTIVKTEE